MDLIAQGRITTNFIAPSFDLLDTFNGYWASVMPAGAKTSMAYPFSRLRTDRFWHRIPKVGYDPDTEYNVSSMERLQEMYFGARMDEELFSFMTQPDTREHLRPEREGRLLDCCFHRKRDVGRRT